MTKKNASQQLKAKGIRTIQGALKYLKGKKIEILPPTPGGYGSGHTWGQAGTRRKIEGIGRNGQIMRMSGLTPTATLTYAIPDLGTSIYLKEFTILSAESIKDLEVEIKDLKKEQKELDKEIDIIKQKIQYLTEQGLEEYDDDQFKAYSILCLIENPKTTKIDKAKLIADLMKQ